MTATRCHARQLYDVPHSTLLGAVQKCGVPSDRVPVRNRDTEDGGNAVQRSLPGNPCRRNRLPINLTPSFRNGSARSGERTRAQAVRLAAANCRRTSPPVTPAPVTRMRSDAFSISAAPIQQPEVYRLMVDCSTGIAIEIIWAPDLLQGWLVPNNKRPLRSVGRCSRKSAFRRSKSGSDIFRMSWTMVLSLVHPMPPPGGFETAPALPKKSHRARLAGWLGSSGQPSSPTSGR